MEKVNVVICFISIQAVKINWFWYDKFTNQWSLHWLWKLMTLLQQQLISLRQYLNLNCVKYSLLLMTSESQYWIDRKDFWSIFGRFTLVIKWLYKFLQGGKCGCFVFTKNDLLSIQLYGQSGSHASEMEDQCPWLTGFNLQDMFTIILMGLMFVAWAFLSFFVHILVAIFFPVVAGGLLGLWIYMWRNTRDLFQVCLAHNFLNWWKVPVLRILQWTCINTEMGNLISLQKCNCLPQSVAENAVSVNEPWLFWRDKI